MSWSKLTSDANARVFGSYLTNPADRDVRLLANGA
jgi:hypothetical protein